MCRNENGTRKQGKLQGDRQQINYKRGERKISHRLTISDLCDQRKFLFDSTYQNV